MLDFSAANQRLHPALFRDEAVSEDGSMEPPRSVVRAFLNDQITVGTLAILQAEPLLRAPGRLPRRAGSGGTRGGHPGTTSWRSPATWAAHGWPDGE